MDMNDYAKVFDWQKYVNRYPDLQKAKINNHIKAWKHVNSYGYKENRVIFEDSALQKQFIDFKNGDILRNYLDNKRVVIVGPADYVNDGKLIDSYDVVIRMNQGHKLTSLSDKYGSRTDILYHCVSQNENNGGSLVYENYKFIKFAYPRLRPSIEHSHKDGTMGDYSKIEWKKNMLIVDKAEYLKFEKELGCRPNCGTVAIWDVLQYNIKELYITGFTLFQTPFHNQYKLETVEEAVSRMEKVGVHDQDKIKKYYQTKMNDRRVKMDAELANILINTEMDKSELEFILYDPFRNDAGHYDDLKNSISNVYNSFFYIHIEDEMLNFTFDNSKSYILYVYVLKNVATFCDMIRRINMKNRSVRLNIYVNLWCCEIEEDLIELKKSEDNVHIISDANITVSKIKYNGRYESFKPYYSINPPIIDSNFKFINKKNACMKKLGKYVVTWSWNNNINDTERWLGENSLIKIRDILKRKNIKLFVFELNCSNDKVEEIYEKNGIFYKRGKINGKSEFFSICKNAEYCIIYSPGNYYSFRSASKFSEFLYNNIKFVTNINVGEVNNIQYDGNIINNLDNIKNVNEKWLTSRSTINSSSWVNTNFKKIMYLLNYSNIVNNQSIDILGNDKTLETYDFNNKRIKLGMNVAYRYWEKINKYPNIYVSLDDVLTPYHAENIHMLIESKKIDIFVLHEKYFDIYPNDAYLQNVFNYSILKPELYLLNSSPHITTGLFSIRLVLSMGFKTLNIYGMSGKYVNFLPESEQVIHNGKNVLKIKTEIKNNPNYFFDEYQKIGDIYNIPNNTNKVYKCICNYHKYVHKCDTGGDVKEPLHIYSYDVLFFDLNRFEVKYKYDVKDSLKVLQIL